MALKTKIKNDLWRVNYILPFVKKHQFDEKGKMDLIQHVLKTYCSVRVVKAVAKKRTVGNDTKVLLGSVDVSISEQGFVYFLDVSKTIAVEGNIISNFTIDYNKLLHSSFQDLVADATKINDEYSKEIQRVAEGVEQHRIHILQALKQSSLAEEVKKVRITEFETMLTKPAHSFEAGLQRVLFFNQIMWQTRHRLNGIGRVDQYLADLYQNDIASGIITQMTAKALIVDFMEKLSSYSSYKSDALEGDIGQILILGGLQEDGTYFSNKLTELFLLVQAELNHPDPKTLLRVSANMPSRIMELAVQCLQRKTGSPLFSNDDVVIPSLVEFGMPEEDAYSYCTSACWEPFIVGKSFDQNNIAVFDCVVAFDDLMNSDESLTFEDLLKRYVSCNKARFSAFLENLDALKWAKDPLVSLLTDSCNQQRKDISDGGAQYNHYGVTVVGLANVVDSLFNIKQILYQDKTCSWADLKEMRDKNFEGNLRIYHFCKANKHYGHDDVEVVALVNALTESLSLIASSYQNKFGGTVKFGLSSPAYNMLNKKMLADFSGRKFGMPYNTHISCMDVAYTEIVNFAGQLSYKGQRFNGNVVDFFVAPNLLKTQKKQFVNFMLIAIDQGYFQMQMNVMDSKTLKDAKQHPEKYPGLIVRVWGFSAYFANLPESYKELLIERAMEAEGI